MAEHKIEELIEFLNIAEDKGFLNSNTAQGRRTACSKLFSVLDDESGRTVEYVRDHLDVIKGRFQRLNPTVTGQTVEIYARRVALVLADFAEWTTDRPAWERKVTAKGAKSNGENAEKRSRPVKARGASRAGGTDDARTLTIQLRSGFEVKVTLPRKLSVADLRHIVWTLAPYADDWRPDVQSALQEFPLLKDRDEERA